MMSPLIALFIKGFVIGFSIAAPIGPIGLLCIRRSLEGGILLGFSCGFGAAVADMLLVLLAGLGFSAINNFFVSYAWHLNFFGGSFLTYLGIKFFFSIPTIKAIAVSTQGVLTTFASTFFLTLANPFTIVCYAAVLTGLGGVGEAQSASRAFMLSSGVLVGASLWWLILSGVTSYVRERIDGPLMKWVNRASGCIVLGFGLFILYKALKACW
jgi:threonine/homoserine/homoserine lactone efflux protein